MKLPKPPRAGAHGVWVGNRTIRTNESACESMPFGRCSCGWEGPGRNDRAAALQDALEHQALAALNLTS